MNAFMKIENFVTSFHDNPLHGYAKSSAEQVEVSWLILKLSM